MTRQIRARRTNPGRLLPIAAGVAGAIALLSVSACSGPSHASAGPSAEPNANRAVSVSGSSGQGAASEPVAEGRGGLTSVNLLAADRAQIKTAGIELRSSRVGDVVTSLEQLATTDGGYVDSENTASDVHGVATSSTVVLRVPVDTFDAAVDEVSGLGQLVSKKTTTQDVTGQVADVNSRVQSARDAIAQLRLLFDRATKLGDIITLESQLSSREADLEALEAEQRSLTAQTTMSTISVHISRPPTPVAKKHQETESGFLGGLRQGWDALGTTAGAVGHGLGALLPFAIALIAIALLVWAAVRRLPRRRPRMSAE